MQTKISKTLAYLLRHNPSAFGLQLTPNGSVSVVGVSVALSEYFNTPVTVEMIEEIVSDDTKTRYRITDGMIRALQGHSIPVELDLVCMEPPTELFHGTATKNVEAIMKHGLERRSRQHVHLSENMLTAEQVGLRHSSSITILIIKAKEAYEAGIKFHLSENNVWLTEHVNPEFIKN